MNFGLTLVLASLLCAAIPGDAQAGGIWTEQLLLPPDGDATLSYGRQVAASGDGSVVVVTARQRQDPLLGKAYVYLRGSDGTFALSQVLDEFVGFSGDFFGTSICMTGNGDKIAIGASPWIHDGFVNEGWVLIYELQNGTYIQVQTLRASRDGHTEDWNGGGYNAQTFGHSMAMTPSGDVLAVGTPQEPGRYWSDGVIYVFRLVNGSYVFHGFAPIRLHEPLGLSVALSGTQVIAGSPRADHQSIWVFESAGGEYEFAQKLVESDPPIPSNDFGGYVAASNGLIFGSSRKEIHVFDAASYSNVAIIDLTNEGISHILAIGASGNRVIAAGPETVGRRICIYVFDRVGDSFVEVEKLTASEDGVGGDGFGNSIIDRSAAVAGDMVVAGTPEHGHSGAAYVFQLRSPSPPTNVPTYEPTKSPTPRPPSPPSILAPWDIEFISVESDFSTSSTDELVLTFEVGRNRKVEHGVYHKDCSTAITGVSVTITESRENEDPGYDTLTLAVDMDKNAIASSNIWNEETNMIEVCTVVHLINEDGSFGEMIMREMKHVTKVDYILDAEYNATIALDESDVREDIEDFDGTEVLSICKCTSLDNFTCNDDPLTPDQNDLFVCYISVDEAIEVKAVESMTISQAGRQSFPAISDGTVRVDAISSTKRKEDGSGYAVWTGVPVAFGNDPGRIAFDFATGSTLTLSGEVSLQLTGAVYNQTGSETRKLQAGAGTAATGATIEGVASYEIQVELKGSDKQVTEVVSVLSSAASVAIGKVATIVAVIASMAH